LGGNVTKPLPLNARACFAADDDMMMQITVVENVMARLDAVFHA
jgi:hypothetical protein